MSGRVLRQSDLEDLAGYMESTGGGYDGLLERIGRIIASGVAEGRFTEAQARHDLDLALWVAYACIGIDDYEHYCTACEWLSRTEDLAAGSGSWHCRYAAALMYCGKPRLALEYASRGVAVDPGHAPGWFLLAELRSGSGDREGALQAVERGRAIAPENLGYAALAQDIEEGLPPEEIELRRRGSWHPNPWTDVYDAYWNGDSEASAAAEAVMGISVDPKGLAEAKAALEPAGWIPDHPYCTFMREGPDGQMLVTLEMNEAFLSKIPSDMLLNVFEELPRMRDEAESRISSAGPVRLCSVSIARDLSVVLGFGDFPDEPENTVSFDSRLRLSGGDPFGNSFVSILLLSDPAFDFESLRNGLVSGLGPLGMEARDDDSLVFEIGGYLVAFTLITKPVPDGEAEDAAANNHLWPGAVDTVRGHRAHVLVALLNRTGDPIDAATVHTVTVAAACTQPNVLGVYFQETVVEPSAYVIEATKIHDGELPILDWVWIGIYRTEDGRCGAYTRGMFLFGREEMEVVDADAPREDVRVFLESVVEGVLEAGDWLCDGDTVGLPDGRTVDVTLSPGRALDEDTIKVAFPKDGLRPARS